MKNFFVSYNKADRAWAEWIAWQLEEAGYSTVIQAWDFRPGSNFVLEMHRAAQEAERTVAVLSPDYLQALYTQPEWTAAFAQDPMGGEQKLLPVRVRECELKGLLGQVIYIDLVGREEDVARDELLKGVSSDRAKPANPPSFPGAFPHSLSERPPFPGARASSASIESHNLLNPLIMKVVERIAKSLWPDKIILFGSRAQGTAGPESDIDLLIIYSGPRSKREVQVAIHQLFEHPDFSLDVFVLTPDELESQRRVANTLAREATERGLASVPVNRIMEIHLAGFTVNRFEGGEVLIDTHNRPIAKEVWRLYEYAVERFGRKPTLIEWDTALPALQVLVDEAERADRVLEATHALAA